MVIAYYIILFQIALMQMNMLKALFIVVSCPFFVVNLYKMVWCKSQKLVVLQQKQTREEIETFSILHAGIML